MVMASIPKKKERRDTPRIVLRSFIMHSKKISNHLKEMQSKQLLAERWILWSDELDSILLRAEKVTNRNFINGNEDL